MHIRVFLSSTGKLTLFSYDDNGRVRSCTGLFYEWLAQNYTEEVYIVGRGPLGVTTMALSKNTAFRSDKRSLGTLARLPDLEEKAARAYRSSAEYSEGREPVWEYALSMAGDFP